MSFQLPPDHPDALRDCTYEGKKYRITHDRFHKITKIRSSITDGVVLDHVIRTMELFSRNALTRGPMAVLAKGLDGATLEEAKLFHLAARVAVEDEYSDDVMYELLKRVAKRDVDYCNIIVSYRAVIYSAGASFFMRMAANAGATTSDESLPYVEVLSAWTAFRVRDSYGKIVGNSGHRVLALVPLISAHAERSVDISSFVLKRCTADPEVISAYLGMAASSAF